MKRRRMMMTRHLLSTIVLATTASSTAFAEQRLIDAPASKADAIMRDVASPRGTSGNDRDRDTFVSGAAVLIAEDSFTPAVARGELGKRIGSSVAFLHVAAGTNGDGELHELRAGVEIRGNGTTIRGFCGADVGMWLADPAIADLLVPTFVPRVGFEIGDQLWLRGAVEAPIVAARDSVAVPFMVTLGLGIKL